MPSNIPLTYRSRDGQHYFALVLIPTESEIEVHCTRHPSLSGQDPDPHKTHLFPSGKLCFVGGRAPTTVARAKELAAQWCEYFLEYRRTGEAQS